MENIFNQYTLVSIAVIAITAFLVIYKYLPQKSKKRKDKESVYLGIWWFFIFISGFALYFISFIQIPQTEEQSPISYWLYTVTISARTSIKMFSFDIAYANVKEIADINVIYCFAIIINFISACLWMIIMAKEIFLKKIANEIKVLLRKKDWAITPSSLIHKLFRNKNEYYYIIIGCGKSMKVFLSNLQKNVDKDQITIITGEVTGKNNKSTDDCFKELIEERYTVIKGKANEETLKRAGFNNAKRKTRIIAITECDEQNLEVADILTQKIFSKISSREEYILAKDNEAKNKAIEKISLDINLEAHIMYSFIERTEHFVFAENAFGRVDFFNPYELRVRDFFWSNPITSLIPHNFIDTKKARLKGDFKADGKIYKPDGKEYIIKNIFIGFGNANYQMLKSSILTGQLLGCDYNATIYDENICTDSKENKPSINQAMFMNHSSGLFSGGDQTLKNEEYFDSPKEKYNIIFKGGNILSKATQNSLINEVENNDFTIIYIALGEDKQGTDNTGRQNKFTKQHACITTFEGLIELSELQAEKKLGKKPDVNNNEDKKAIAKADTIYYDFNLMDELATRLEVSDKVISLYSPQS